MAFFTAYVQTSSNGSRIERAFEVPDDELDVGINEDCEDVISSYAQDAIMNDYEWGWVPDGES